MTVIRGQQMQNEINQFLSDLRDSGRINMFAATPYLESRFGLTRREAKAALLDWIESFKKGSKQ
jgi:hypothetical protein